MESSISSNNKTTVFDYLGGSHYCSCSCHIQAFPSKMDQGVIAFIFSLAKVFIDVLRKNQRIFHKCCMYNRSLQLSDQHHVLLLYEQKNILIGLIFSLLSLFVKSSLSFWRISCPKIKKQRKNCGKSQYHFLTTAKKESQPKKVTGKGVKCALPLWKFRFLTLKQFFHSC